jgi:hypothetical protein
MTKFTRTQSTLAQSNIKCVRTLTAWLYETHKIAQKRALSIEIDRQQAAMYFNGGYSPKMAIHDHLRIPANLNLFE